jgi:DNA-binding Xre family transcriptional regulator
MPVNSPLDKELVDRVLSLAKEMNGKQIADSVGITPNRVWYILKKHKVKPKKTHYRDISQVLEIIRYCKIHKRKKTLEKFGINKHQLQRCYIRYRKIQKKFIEREPQLRQAAYSYAIVKANCIKETAEEFASYCVEKFIEKDKGVFFETAFADFMRERLGRTGTAKSDANKATLSLLEKEVSYTMSDDGSVYDLLPKTINGLLVALVYKYGLTKREISQHLGVTESAVGIRINKTIERIRDKYGRSMA